MARAASDISFRCSDADW